MDVQKNVCFVSKLRYLNVQKDPGFTVQRAVPGGTTAVNLPAEFVKFKDHRCLTNSPEIIEFLRKIMAERPQLGIREIRDKTKQELYEEEMAKLKDQIARTEKARGDLPTIEEDKKVEQEKVVESAEKVAEKKEQTIYTEKCPDCDWVAESSVSEAQMKNKLRGHRIGKHKK